tara:strand:+ start:114 stop:2177 length:2064 start_codon:yes stop_codon:yes gene_type:complete
MKRLVSLLSLFIVFATSSFLFGDISRYVTSADINSIAFRNSENYAKLVSVPISEKNKIVSSVLTIDQLGLEKLFIQNMAKNNFGDDGLLMQVKMFNILQNFNSELANYFDIVALENRPQLACFNENMKMVRMEQARLIRILERNFNHALEDLNLIKKEMDETSMVSFMDMISQYSSPFNELSFWNEENIENYWYEILRELNTISNLVKPNLFLDISILEKPLSTYFYKNDELELIKISTPSNQSITSNKQEKFSFSKILPYFYEDSELETMNIQNARLLESVLGTYSNYLEISDQIPLFNLEREIEQTNLSTERESPDTLSDADCKKDFEYILKLQRDIALLKIREEIFSVIMDDIKKVDSYDIELQRRLPPIANRISDSWEQFVKMDNNHLYGFDDYQILLSNTKKIRGDSFKMHPFDIIVTLLQFGEKLSTSKHQVKISKNNIFVSGKIISADILHIGDLSYFKSSNNQLYGYFSKGQWNILDQYETYLVKAFETFEKNNGPNIESIIIPAPKDYVSAAKEHFESLDSDKSIYGHPEAIAFHQQKREKDLNAQFESKIILEQQYSYCRNLYQVAINSFNQNSIYGRQQRSNDVVLQMYERAASDKNIDQMSKIADLAAKGYDFSGLDSISSMSTKSNSLSAINRLANVAWSNSYMNRHGVMSEYNFASTIESICRQGEDFRKFIN